MRGVPRSSNQEEGYAVHAVIAPCERSGPSPISYALDIWLWTLFASTCVSLMGSLLRAVEDVVTVGLVPELVVKQRHCSTGGQGGLCLRI